MSTLQWLGIWAMTGFSKVERSDLDRWSKGITYLLADPKGLHYFKEFLNEPAREFGTQAQYLSVWEKCDRLVNESRISEDEANEIFNDAECLSINLGDTTQIERDIMSGEEVKVREAIIHVRDAAKDDLSTVYSAFITFTHNVKSPKKEKWGFTAH